ncbi:hypothetical protein TEA_008373 [Camellia sinensis var. sinensis]|uniref:Peptidase A1 domain-containing protein n=1 Tax=Camellia sinensis var. sinensis TaxID=542762 RepID=A0A4S4DTZ0_CAMSN|nr:hypothetical protein TEA_008373 [Camellia sinensis var. sinensis]
MNNKRKRVPMELVLFLVVFFTTFQGSFGASKQTKSKASYGIGSSVVFRVTGNVYPNGVFLFCFPGNMVSLYVVRLCVQAPHALYKPNKNLVRCDDPLCASLHWPANKPCETPDDQCDYEIEYADHGSSMGVLIRDSFPLSCGYNQEVPDSFDPPYTDGVLGLTGGQLSIVSQLHKQGITRNILGHCLSGKGGGFLFFGNDLVPSSRVVWVPMLLNSLEKRYVLGPTELLYGNRATGVKGLLVVFDSGSTYSYLSSDAYKATLAIVKEDLNGKQLKDAVEDQNLPVCWKGAKPFKSIHDVKNYFKPLVLRFTKPKNVQLQLPPSAYLIITKHGNACLGILNGSEVGLGNNNILGDISLQDKMVIYDNEKQQIGWVAENCDRLLNTDRDYIGGSSQPFASNMDILEEHLKEEFLLFFTFVKFSQMPSFEIHLIQTGPSLSPLSLLATKVLLTTVSHGLFESFGGPGALL